MSARIANRDARSYVERRVEFRGSNLYAKHRDRLYCVWSYGEHFPIAVYDFDVSRWFHNHDRYSSSTSRHQSRVGRPGEARSTDELTKLIDAGGVLQAISRRLEGR